MKPSEYTFETYVTTPSNRFARIAAETISKSSEINFDPLYIYGPPGVGKTHLLHAMAKEYRKQKKIAICVSASQFCEEMIAAIRNGTNAEFREKYQQADALLIDRLEYVAGKEATQEELFNIWAKRHFLNHKQTIFAGNAHPTQIPMLERKLSSHLALGLCVEIPTPDFEEKAKIILQKLKAHGMDWPMDACRYVALNVSSSARQIEGEINKILAFRELL